MEPRKLTFRNDGDFDILEQVFLCDPIDLGNGGFHVALHPLYGVWGLGLRFFNGDPRHPSIAKLSDSDQKKLGVKEIQVGLDSEKHAVYFKSKFFNEDEAFLELYEESLPPSLSVFVKYIPGSKSLYFSLTIDQEVQKNWLLPIGGAFENLQLYAWTESRRSAFDAVITEFTESELVSNFAPFRLGNLIVRYGDMFDSAALNKSNLIILPAASDGSVNANILNRATELQIPNPRKSTAGTIAIYNVIRSTEKLFAGYAYSVQDFSSGVPIIEKICKRIIEYCKRKAIRGINIPLLGGGAGKMPPEVILLTYQKAFNVKGFDIDVVVSVERQDTFLSLKAGLRRDFLPLPVEPRPPKPPGLLNLEYLLNIELADSAYKADENGIITELNLRGIKVNRSIWRSDYLQGLKRLNLTETGFDNYDFLSKLKSLEFLYLGYNRINELTFLEDLHKLEVLDLSYNNIVNLEPLSSLQKLRDLNLRGNNLSDISPIQRLRKLRNLDLSQNYLHEIRALRGFTLLKTLDISRNEFTDLSYLKGLVRLEILNISDNQLEDVRFLTEFKRLRFLQADNNPFIEAFGLKLAGAHDHLSPILGYYERQDESVKFEIILPVKVLVLGNHGSGKSSLLHYLLTGQLSADQDSTHIIRIEKYQLPGQLVPEAIFFDFGGQDYYHGLYRAFLSAGSVYLILWNNKTNVNARREDRNTVLTQDFTVDYWIAQKDYQEQKADNVSEDPILLIQTHADNGVRQNITDVDKNHLIKNEHFVSLKDLAYSNGKLNIAGLHYLKASIFDLVEKKRLVREEPQWYIDFITFILDFGSKIDHHCVSVKYDILPNYHKPGKNKADHLDVELTQLHLQGLILYYPKQIPDRVWLNPMKLVEHIHNTLLDKENALINRNGEVKIEPGDSNEKAIIQLLIEQKVLYSYEQNGTFIIPNFLPLAGTGDDFDLMAFGIGDPLFVLKFNRFLPFGLINQMICYFGELPQRKKFWRDQLIFTIDDKVKVLINLNFQTLEIKIFASFKSKSTASDSMALRQYLFYATMGLYWDKMMLSYREYSEWRQGTLVKDGYPQDDPMFQKLVDAEDIYANKSCYPLDLFISLNDKDFVQYSLLCDEQYATRIPAFRVDEHKSLRAAGAVPLYPFQPFTMRRLVQPLKAIISYAKRDIAFVDQFKLHLVPLIHDGLLLPPWQDVELLAGEKWNETIQQKFDEADIVFFMISPNLMAIDYVMEHEIKTTLARHRKGDRVKIVPVILSAYSWGRKAADIDLSDFLALPFGAFPVASYPNEDEAWKYVARAIRIMIEKELYGTEKNMMSNNDMDEFRKKVMEARKGFVNTLLS